MKPIPSNVSNEVIVTLRKAKRLLQKAEKLEMIEHEGKKVPAFAADGKGAKDAKNKGEGHEAKIKECLKKKGGAASLEECAKECGVSPEECKKVIDKMSDVKISPHGDVVLMDGLQKGEKCPSCGANKMDCTNKMGGCGSMKMKKGFEQGAQPGFSTSFDSNPQGVMFVAESGGQTRNAYYTTNQYPYNGEDVANKGSTSESFNMESISGQMNPHDGNGVDRMVVEGHLSKARDMLAKARCVKCGGDQYSGCRMGLGPRCPGLAGAGEPRRL